MSAAATPERRAGNRFTSRFTNSELFGRVIPEVALEAKADSPESVSLRAWNDARAEAGYPDAPSAEAIHQRFNKMVQRDIHLSWHRIVEGSLQDDRVRQQLLARWVAAPEASDIGEDEAYYGLRRVSRELEVTGMTRLAYDACRDDLVAADARKAVPLDLGSFLPTSEQISRKLRGWRTALTWAGLHPDPAGATQPRPDEPDENGNGTAADRSVDAIAATNAGAAPIGGAAVAGTQPALARGPSKSGMTPAEATVVFAEANGRLPAHDELRAFMRDCELGLQDPPGGTRWTEFRDQAEVELLARYPSRTFARPGHGGDRRSAGRKRGYSYALPAEATLLALRETVAQWKGAHPESKWDRPAVLAALAEYAAVLRAGQDGRQRHYLQLAPKHGWPPVKNINRHGRFQALLAEARQAALPPSTPPSSGQDR